MTSGSRASLSWLDQAFAVPVIGIHFLTNFRLLFDSFQIFAPFLNELNATFPHINYAVEPASGLNVQTPAGFTYAFHREKMVVEFAYPMITNKVPGSFPRTEFGTVQPYSVLLQKTRTEFLRLAAPVFSSRSELLVTKVGVVALTSLDVQNLPPGVLRFWRHLYRPWQQPFIKSDINLVSVLSKAEEHLEQCHHLLRFDENQEKGEFLVNLDWQRRFINPIKPNLQQLESIVDSGIEGGLKYFERFGEGDLEYE